MTSLTLPADAAPIRPPAVAGGFYPGRADELADVVSTLLAEGIRPRAETAAGTGAPVGILVPHAGLAYSGLVAAAGWAWLTAAADAAVPPTIVLLGTNHVAAWLDGVGAWDAGAWRTPLGDIAVEPTLAAAIVGLGSPYTVDRLAHHGEHSIEVQLPFIQVAAPTGRIVPLAVAAGTGRHAIEAGRRLGELLAARRAKGEPVVLAISSDMAHYPPADVCTAATETLLPAIEALDSGTLARTEASLRAAGLPGVACGMCGIEPTVVGLAALEAMGARTGRRLAAATSAEAGGPADRTVGYLAVAFEA